MEQQADLELLKDIPGFKIILRAVMKDQMKYLAEQLSKHAGEETLIVTASVADGTSSHLGSHGGIGFVEHRDEIKSQFLGHCIKNSQARPVPVHMHTTPVNEISPDHATQPALLYAGQPPLLYAAQPSVLHAGQPVHQKPDQGSLLRRPPSGIHSVKISKTTSGSNTIQQSDKHGLVRKMPSSETVSSNPPPLKQARMCTSSINETDYATADIRIKMEDQCDKEENISRTDYTSRHTSQIVTGEQPSTSQANFSRSVDQPDISDLSYQIKIEPIEDLDVYDMSGQFECSADEADGNNDISTATETDTEMNAEESNEIMGQNQSDSSSSAGRFVMYEKVAAQEFIDSHGNELTVKKTSSDMNQFKSFLVSCHKEFRNIEEIPISELDIYFGNFLLGARKVRDHSEYEPSTLRGFMSSLDRYLRKNNCTFTALKNPLFPHSNKALIAKQKDLRQRGFGNKQNEADELTEADIEYCFQEGVIGVHNPVPLINLLHLKLSLMLGIRGGKEQRALKWGDITVVTEGGAEYLVRKKETEKGKHLKNVRKFKPKAWSCDLKERCPVNAIRIYESHRPIDMWHPDAPFFLGIATKEPEPGQPWYKSCPMGVNTIYRLTKNMKLECSRKVNKPSKVHYWTWKTREQNVADIEHDISSVTATLSTTECATELSIIN